MVNSTILTSQTAALRASLPAAIELDGWELARLVGEGELARVYQARPTRGSGEGDAAYAVKLLKAPWDNDPRGWEMLAREARVSREVSQAHLVPILAANLAAPPYFVVMPLLTGTTLARLIARGQRPSVPEALWVARQLAEALAALHAARWMHGDVKPGNVFVSPAGHATLIDLGFARRRGEEMAIGARPILGTLAYMPPEMLVSTLAPDARSDIYSLGVTLFHWLTGRLPFDADTPEQLVLQHRQELPADLRVLAPHLPTRVARLIRQMLAKEPLRRPQSAADLIERLAALEIEHFSERLAL